MTDTYHPISCEFHDLLEASAIKRKPAHIEFRDADGQTQTRVAVIIDVYAEKGADYLKMDTGETLRLDQVIAMDGEKLADY